MQALLQLLQLPPILPGIHRQAVVDAVNPRIIHHDGKRAGIGRCKVGIVRRGNLHALGKRRRPRLRKRPLLRERPLDGVDQHARYDDVGAALVLAVDHRPRREVEVGHLEQLAVELALLLVAPRARQLLVGHAPAGRGVVVQALEPLSLRLLAHVQEQLHHHVAVVGQLPLEIAHRRGVAARLVAQGGRLVRSMGHHALYRRAVPALIEEGDGAALAERPPILLHERVEIRDAARLAGEMAQRGLIDVPRNVHARRTGVEVVHQIRDPAALPRSVPALEQDDEADPLRTRLLLQDHQTLHQGVALRLVLLLRQRLVIELDLLQHGQHLLRYVSSNRCALIVAHFRLRAPVFGKSFVKSPAAAGPGVSVTLR